MVANVSILISQNCQFRKVDLIQILRQFLPFLSTKLFCATHITLPRAAPDVDTKNVSFLVYQNCCKVKKNIFASCLKTKSVQTCITVPTVISS